MPVFHTKSARDRSERDKPEPLIQVPRVYIGGDHSVELHNFKIMLPGLRKAVEHQLFADVLSPAPGAHRKARVADMSASADVVGMQNIHSVYFRVIFTFCDSTIRLLGKKRLPRFLGKIIFLRESDSLFNDFIPNPNHFRNIVFPILSDYYIHFSTSN